MSHQLASTFVETPLTVVDTSSVDLTAGATGNGHTGLSAAIKLSATAGNAISLNADGIYTPTVTETPLTVTDSSTVDLTAGATGNGHTGLTAAVKISASANNAIVANADGIYAAVQTFTETPVTVLDSSTVDMTAGATGSGHTGITASVKVSAVAGNVLSTNADGLYVPTPTVESTLTVLDSATVDMTAGATGAGHTGLTASVKLSAANGNIITANADGLYAPTPTAETALTVTDSATVDLTAGATGSGHTGLTASVKLSATAGNTLTANADGLYVPTVTETPITVTDSATVDLTAGATGSGHTGITASVKLSATAGNILSINADGLYASVTAELDDQVLTGINTNTATLTLIPTTVGTQVNYSAQVDVKVSATAGNSITVNADGLYAPTATQTPLTVTDSSSVDFTASGTDNHTLTATVKVSATAGNSITTNADGIYVATPTQTPLTVNDSTSIDFTANGTDNHTLTGVVKVSSTANNVLVINADGLYVPQETSLIGNDTATVDLTASGTNGHSLSAAVKISSTAGNIIVANADGIYASTTTAETALTVVDSATVDLTAGATGNGHTGLTADVKISATAGNLLVANADGLYVTETPLTVTDSNTIDLTAGPAGSGHTGLTASVIVSPDAGNILTANANGLYAAGGADNGVSFSPADGTTAYQHYELGGTLHKTTTVARNGNTFEVTSTSSGLKVDGTSSQLSYVNGTDKATVDASSTNAMLAFLDSALSKTALVQAVAGDKIEVDAQTILFTDYPSTRDDAGTPCNVLSTDSSGNVQSHSIKDVATDRRTVRNTAVNTVLVPSTDYIVAGSVAGINIVLAQPGACDPQVFHFKNISSGQITVTAQGGATIEGLGFVTLDGTVAGGYAFGNNGGESVMLAWNGAVSEWMVI